MLNCALILIWFSVASQSIASFYPTYLGGADEKQTEVLRSTCKAGLQLIFDALREQNIAGGFFEKKTNKNYHNDSTSIKDFYKKIEKIYNSALNADRPKPRKRVISISKKAKRLKAENLSSFMAFWLGGVECNFDNIAPQAIFSNVYENFLNDSDRLLDFVRLINNNRYSFEKVKTCNFAKLVKIYNDHIYNTIFDSGFFCTEELSIGGHSSEQENIDANERKGEFSNHMRDQLWRYCIDSVLIFANGNEQSMSKDLAQSMYNDLGCLINGMSVDDDYNKEALLTELARKMQELLGIQ